MDVKTVVKYATYVVGGAVMISLIHTVPYRVAVLALCAAVNIVYVGRK